MYQDMAKISLLLSPHNAAQLPIRFSIIKIQFSMIYLDDVTGVCAWVFRALAFGTLNANSAVFLQPTIPFSTLSLSSFEYCSTRHTHTHTHVPMKQVSFKWKTHDNICGDAGDECEVWAEDAKNTNHFFYHPQRSNVPLRNIQMAHGNAVCVWCINAVRAKALIYFQ